MTDHNTPSTVCKQTPLEGDWIERPLAVVVEGQPVSGLARANWGAVEATITLPIAGVTRRRDSRGWCFAMLAHHRPEERFALGGEFTAKGLAAAGRLLTDLYLDWLAVSRHEVEVDEQCRRLRQELSELGKLFEVQRQPTMQARQALRHAFRSGELAQQDYQRRLKELAGQLNLHDREHRETEQATHDRFSAWLEGCTGRRVSLEEAESFLTDVAIVVRADS